MNLVGDPKQISALVVDGNTLSRSIIVSQLREVGVTHIQVASRAEDARRRLEISTYDLVVCEYHFDKSIYTGRDLLDDLRQHNLLPLSTTFVMVSNEASYPRVAEAAETALDGYLLKPYAAKSLLERIAAARYRKLELKSIFDAIESNQMEQASALCMDYFDTKGRYWLYTARIGAEISLNLGKLDVAQRLYSIVTEEKALPWARLGIAKVQGVQGHLREARTTLDNLIADHRSYVDAYDVMARIQLNQGQLDDAFFTYQKACELTPGALTRLQKAGLLAQYTGRAEEAERLMERAMRIGAGSKMFDPISSVVYGFCKYQKNDEKALARCSDDLALTLERDPENLRLKRFVDTTESLLLALQRKIDRLTPKLEGILRDVMSPVGDFEAATNLVTLLSLIAERASNKTFADRALQLVGQRFASSRITLDVLVGSASVDEHKDIVRDTYQQMTERIQAAIARTLEGGHEAAVRDLIAGAKETGNARFVETAEGSLKRHARRIGAAVEEMAADIEAIKASLGDVGLKEMGLPGGKVPSTLSAGPPPMGFPAVQNAGV